MNKDYFSLVDDLREKIYIALKSIGINPLGRTMSFKKVKNKSVLSLNISERNNERKSDEKRRNSNAKRWNIFKR